MNPPILDNLEEMKKLDKSNVLGSIQALADQIEDAWTQVQELDIKIDTGRVQNIVVSGMGGSGLGPDVIKQTFKGSLKMSFEVYNDYHLPAYVNSNSLVILASYSGTTEETLSAAQDAIAAGAQILVITTGGDLQKLKEEHGWSGYIINPRHNPSNQPRMALGYAVFGVIAMLTKAGILNVSHDEVISVVNTVKATLKDLNVDVMQDKNPAKQMAFQILGRVPVMIAAEHLAGGVHVFQNQLNENSKSYAELRLIPELNHHLMEALQFPQELEKNLFFLLFNSTMYHPRNQKRFEVTQDVIERAHIEATSLMIDSSTALEQNFEVIAFGAFVNFYLAMLEGIDPAPIPTVDYFKEQLKK
jgi:glucose/mannose-6-phosphate isomerase